MIIVILLLYSILFLYLGKLELRGLGDKVLFPRDRARPPTRLFRYIGRCSCCVFMFLIFFPVFIPQLTFVCLHGKRKN